ncbi:MAG TPA: branched-chain amino acid ABC transporter permease [Xanthobacteraceae bacterium]|jgi:branched-chain amino acid transport system permease protein
MTVQLLLQGLVNGVGLSMVYILVALGLTLIFSILRIINFAHGEFYMMGGFISYYCTQYLQTNYVLTIIIAFGVVLVAGILVERLIFSRLRANLLAGFIASLGLLWIMQSSAILIFGVVDKEVHGAFDGVVRAFGVVIAKERLFVIACCAGLIACFYLFLRTSRHGIALRAIAQDSDAAALQGVDVNRLSAWAFGIGCAIAAVAGALLAPVYFVSPSMGTLPVIKAFIIIILGGMGSLLGAVYGGFLIGLLESIAPLYFPAASVEMLGFLVVMAVLVVRPQGLFGNA